MTPYEKNLEFWRELWRVIERSDILIQIVDARNPLLYFSSDLNKYVGEVSSDKKCILLLNKSDLLTENQRKYWAEYFESKNIKALFWSAMKGTETSETTMSSIPESEEIQNVEENKENSKENVTSVKFNDPHVLSKVELVNYIVKLAENFYKHSEETQIEKNDEEEDCDSEDSSLELSEDEAMPEKVYSRRPFTIGFVGYPNVGKSSTLNALMGSKKVSVSATPGHTKHLQTIYLSQNIMFCDCPGLVFPSFVHTRADLVISGILSVDENRDYIGPVNTICSQIPKIVFEVLYGVNIKPPPETDDPERPVCAHELLGAICYMRGYMTSTGVPHYDRAARQVVKDYFNGRLLYCHAPATTPLDVFLYDKADIFPGNLKKMTRWQEKMDKDILLSSHIAESCSLANKRKRKSSNSRDGGSHSKLVQSQVDSILTKFDKMILTENYISQMKKLSFSGSGQRSKRHIPRLVEEEPEEEEACCSLNDDTVSLASHTSSRLTTARVGGRNLLSGVSHSNYRSDDIYRGRQSQSDNFADDKSDWETATSMTSGQAWRRLSNSKKAYFPGALLIGETENRGSARPRKKKEKLRRIYSALDQHEM